MPLKVIGMIGVAPPARSGTEAATVHVIDGGVSPRYLVDFARAHDEAGFDLVLVGYTSTSADGWSVATHAAANTARVGYLIAHRPGFVAPTLAARKAATFDQLSEGRFALHIIAGAGDRDQRRDGDWLTKTERYARAAEYVEVMRRTWTATEPFDHDGTWYRMADVRSEVRPYQQPAPPVFFGGSSPEALAMGAEHCDVYAVFGEPLAATAERFDHYRSLTGARGRRARFSISFRPILGRTEGEAWDRARRIQAAVEASGPGAIARLEDSGGPRAFDHGGERMLAHAAAGEVHDDCLWMKIAELTGAPGNTSCLVGTPEQVARAITRYYELGDLGYVLVRGFDPLADATDFGRELIPRVKALADEIDSRRTSADP
jgi:alkanesulfonate monooxygenase